MSKSLKKYIKTIAFITPTGIYLHYIFFHDIRVNYDHYKFNAA